MMWFIVALLGIATVLLVGGSVTSYRLIGRDENALGTFVLSGTLAFIVGMLGFVALTFAIS